jgi:hypothetical protein
MSSRPAPKTGAAELQPVHIDILKTTKLLKTVPKFFFALYPSAEISH